MRSAIPILYRLSSIHVWDTMTAHYQSPERKRGVIYRIVTIMLVLIALCGGCASAPKSRTMQPAVDMNRLSDLEFTHYLASTPIATVDEGLRAVLLLTGDSTRWPDFHSRRDELIRRGAFKRNWSLQPNSLLDRGTLAHMLRSTCRLKRGANEVIFGSVGFGDRRYALHTCIYEGIIPPGRATDSVTGGELLNAITLAQQHNDAKTTNAK